MPPVDASTARPAPRLVRSGSLTFAVVSSPGGASTDSHAPVVLIHGIGMSHRYLARLQRQLARDREVYAIDLPGFGGVPKPQRDVSIPVMASALGEVIASLERGPVVLVGQSMGAQWVVELARQRPELVARLIMIGPVADARHRTAFAQMRALALDSFVERPSTNVVLIADYLRCGIRWYLAQLRHMLRYRIEDAVAELPMPVMVLRGGLDPIAGVAWCRSLRDRAPHGVLVTVPGGPHNVQDAAPRAVAAALRAGADLTVRQRGPAA